MAAVTRLGPAGTPVAASESAQAAELFATLNVSPRACTADSTTITADSTFETADCTAVDDSRGEQADSAAFSVTVGTPAQPPVDNGSGGSLPVFFPHRRPRRRITPAALPQVILPPPVAAVLRATDEPDDFRATGKVTVRAALAAQDAPDDAAFTAVTSARIALRAIEADDDARAMIALNGSLASDELAAIEIALAA